MLAPVIVQQNSVYPSQHSDPHAQLEPLQLQSAAYADVGRSRKSFGTTATALPTIAVFCRKLRRLVPFRPSSFAARSASFWLMSPPPRDGTRGCAAAAAGSGRGTRGR